MTVDTDSWTILNKFFTKTSLLVQTSFKPVITRLETLKPGKPEHNITNCDFKLLACDSVVKIKYANGMLTNMPTKPGDV